MLSAYNPYYSDLSSGDSTMSQTNPQAYQQYQLQQGYQTGQQGLQLGQGQPGANYPAYNPQAQSYQFQFSQLKPSIIQQTAQQIQAKPTVQPQQTLPNMQPSSAKTMIAQLPLAMQQLMAKTDTTNMNPGVSINDSKPPAQTQQQIKAPSVPIQFAVGSSILKGIEYHLQS